MVALFFLLVLSISQAQAASSAPECLSSGAAFYLQILRPNNEALLRDVAATYPDKTKQYLTQNPSLCLVKHASMARYMVSLGANPHDAKQKPTQGTLLHRATWPKHEPELITFYREQGFSPLDQDEQGNNALHELINSACDCGTEELYHKRMFLMQGLSDEQTNTLISMTNHAGKTPLDRLEREKPTIRMFFEYLTKS